MSIHISGSFGLSGNGINWDLNPTSNGYIQTSRRPRFFAYGASNGTSLLTLIFSSTQVNVGNHYNNSTGLFTAPVNGTYFFTWSSIANNTNDVYRMRFRLNGANVRDVHLRSDTQASGANYGTNMAKNFMIEMAVGDTASIYFQSDSNNPMYIGADFDYFGGWLLG